MLPRRYGQHAPRPKRPKVIHQIRGKDRIPLVERLRSEIPRIVPAKPDVPGPQLLRLPPQVRLFRVTDLVRGVADELRIPLRDAELPWRLRASPVPLPFVPAAIHGPVPTE